MELPKKLFRELGPDDFFGLKVLKDGFNPALARGAFQDTGNVDIGDQRNVLIGNVKKEDNLSQEPRHYLQDVVVPEEKRMNAHVKIKYLDDFAESLQAHSKNGNTFGSNRIGGRDAQIKNKEMQ